MYDVVIIGAGVAGMTAALNLRRNNRTVLILEEESIGGQMATSPRVENYPSFKAISGGEIADKVFEQISDLGAELELEKVTGIVKNGKGFIVKAGDKEYPCKSVIIATGVKHKHLRFKNEEEFVGKGISYCALCDGAFYKGEEVAVVGDGNSALQYAILMSSYCPKVYVYTLFDKFFGDKQLVDTLLSKENVIWKPNTALCEYLGENEFEGFKYKENGEIKEHRIKGLFVAIGQVPDNKKFEDVVALDKDGFIIADETCKTSCEGIFVAGDCRTKAVRQIVTSIADGSVSALNASLYIDNNFKD